MIDLHFWPTPNGQKVLLFLEEASVPHRVVPLNITRGAQHTPEFRALNPNGKMPAIVDHAPAEGGDPIVVFESGAILEYLADKTGHFLPRASRARFEVLQWLYWQMAGLGPMLGQAGHFKVYAKEKIPYAIERYVGESKRLLGVLDKQLAGREFIAGEYSIADMAAWPWARGAYRSEIDLAEFPEVKRWIAAIEARPAAQRTLEISKATSSDRPVDDEARKHLFQTSGTPTK